MLRTTTKNLAHEIVSLLIDVKGGSKGILTDILKWLGSNLNHIVIENTQDLHYSILESFKDKSLVKNSKIQ
jgi:hypothetical protein